MTRLEANLDCALASVLLIVSFSLVARAAISFSSWFSILGDRGEAGGEGADGEAGGEGGGEGRMPRGPRGPRAPRGRGDRGARGDRGGRGGPRGMTGDTCTDWRDWWTGESIGGLNELYRDAFWWIDWNFKIEKMIRFPAFVRLMNGG